MKKTIKSQFGQSMPEFIVAMLVLGPLFVIVPKIGQYIDVAHTTTVATRFAGFESLLYHPLDGGGSSYTNYRGQNHDEENMADLNKKVQEHFFENNPSAKALVKEVKTERPYLEKRRSFKNVGLLYYNYRFNLETTDYRIVQVTASLNDLPWKSDADGPTEMKRYIVTPSGDWDAKSPVDVKYHVSTKGPHWPRTYIKSDDDDPDKDKTMGTGVLGAFTETKVKGKDDLVEEGEEPVVPLTAIMKAEGHTGLSGRDIVEFDPDLVPADRLQ